MVESITGLIFPSANAPPPGWVMFPPTTLMMPEWSKPGRAFNLDQHPRHINIMPKKAESPPGAAFCALSASIIDSPRACSHFAQ
jgi:hypothetical protein